MLAGISAQMRRLTTAIAVAKNSAKAREFKKSQLQLEPQQTMWAVGMWCWYGYESGRSDANVGSRVRPPR